MAERAAKQLELNKSELPNSITEVIATLSRAGFDAYIVGGGVRDTLLGLQPKDFDAVTDAKPHEIKDVFGKRCRIIGRRFQLAHVYSGRDLIEVATFRAPPASTANTTQDGMIIRDNVWGDIKQDFARRDFSINALYYQPLKGIVHDYCGALDDIRNKTIRLLGDAPVRIEEDPVRLLRALRFKAKLGFEFDAELSEQFTEANWARLEQISPHRLYDETQKMFTGGYLVPLLPLLFESGAIDSLFIYPPAEPSALVKQVAFNTDKRIASGKSINPAFFYAALLWENYLHQLEKAKKRNMPFADAQMQAAGKVIDRQRIKTAIPKFAEQFIRDIWLLQPKLAAPRSKQIEQLSEHPRFRAGFDFLLLREQCDGAAHPLSESTNGMGDWWQTYQTLSEKEQQQAIADFDETLRRGAHKRSRGRNRQKQGHSASANDHAKQDASNQSRDHQGTNNQDRNNQNSAKQDAAKQAVNDATNIPAKRRRRAESRSTGDNSANTNTDKAATPSSKWQAKQDRQELIQLQQLSLASGASGANKRKASQPKPLFVIEHDPVVPPLKRQSADSKASVKAKTSEATTAVTPKAQADAPTASQTRSEHAGHSQAAAKPAKEKAPRKTSAHVKTATEVAQTPRLDMMGNEPIPAKRRRKPSHAPSAAAVPSAPAKRDKPTSYTKKAPKSAPVSSAASVPTDTPADSNKEVSVAANKGPIPAKRRRRQPSTANSDSA